jgi:hypothetical protein
MPSSTIYNNSDCKTFCVKIDFLFNIYTKSKHRSTNIIKNGDMIIIFATFWKENEFGGGIVGMLIECECGMDGESMT